MKLLYPALAPADRVLPGAVVSNYGQLRSSPLPLLLEAASNSAVIPSRRQLSTRGRCRRIRTRRLSPISKLVWRIIASDTQPGRARGLLKAWPAWERLSERLRPTNKIPGAQFGLLRMRVVPCRADELPANGLALANGSRLAELHCDNRAILRTVQANINPFAACRQDLRSLAAWAESDPLGRTVEAFRGLTLLGAGAKRMGFNVFERPLTIRRHFQRIFFAGLLLLYTGDGLKRIEYGSTLSSYPAEVWISRQALLDTYGRATGQLMEPGERWRNPANSGIRDT